MSNEEQKQVEKEQVVVTQTVRADATRVVLWREVTRFWRARPDRLRYFAKDPWGVRLAAHWVEKFPWRSAMIALAVVFNGAGKLPPW